MKKIKVLKTDVKFIYSNIFINTVIPKEIYLSIKEFLNYPKCMRIKGINLSNGNIVRENKNYIIIKLWRS